MAFNFIRAVKILPVFLSIELLFALNVLHPVHAQPLPTHEETVEEVIRTRVNFTSNKEGSLDDSATGSSRDGLTLVLPEKYGSLGLTIKAQPLLFIGITNSNIKEAYFILQEQETQEVIYETKLSLKTNGTGIISVNLPSDAPTLEIGKTYDWIVSSSNGSTVNGKIKRVELDSTVSNQIENAEALEKAALYAENGIWFETLDILAELKRSQPDNEIYAREWSEFLKSVGLNDIAAMPLVK